MAITWIFHSILGCIPGVSRVWACIPANDSNNLRVATLDVGRERARLEERRLDAAQVRLVGAVDREGDADRVATAAGGVGLGLALVQDAHARLAGRTHRARGPQLALHAGLE